MIWRRWSGFSAAFGAVAVPIVYLWLLGRTPLALLAWPLRYLWTATVVRRVVCEGWISARPLLVAVAIVAGVTAGTLILDLSELIRAPQVFFFLMEAWQLPVYYWIDLLPRSRWLGRPDYLWMIALWTVVEGVIAVRWLSRLEEVGS